MGNEGSAQCRQAAGIREECSSHRLQCRPVRGGDTMKVCKQISYILLLAFSSKIYIFRDPPIFFSCWLTCLQKEYQLLM